jgi:hypothetical protein
VLFRRLNEHAQSIAQAENLELSDFSCRYLVVDDIWIPLGESLLIEKFAPIWTRPSRVSATMTPEVEDTTPRNHPGTWCILVDPGRTG